MDPFSLLWLFFILASLQPGFQRQMLLLQRRRALSAAAAPGAAAQAPAAVSALGRL